MKRVITVIFPCEVKQVGPGAIEIPAAPLKEPVIHGPGFDALAVELSAADRDRFYDDAVEWMQGQAIIRSLRVVSHAASQ